MFKQSYSIVIVNSEKETHSKARFLSSELLSLIDQGRLFSVVPNVPVYNIVAEDPYADGVISLVMFLYGEGRKVRFWYDLSLTEDYVFQLKSYVDQWFFYCPSLDSHEYQRALGNHSYDDASVKLTAFLNEGVPCFLYIPIYNHMLDLLPEWVDLILEKKIRVIFYFQKSLFTRSQRKSIRYFEQFSFVHCFALPCTCDPLWQLSEYRLSLDRYFFYSKIRNKYRRLKLFFGI